MPRISTDNYDTVASWNGSQDLFVVEQPDGTKVATPAMVKQFIEAGDFEATGEVKDGHGNILKDMAKSADVDAEIGDLSQTGLTGDSVAAQLGTAKGLVSAITNLIDVQEVSVAYPSSGTPIQKVQAIATAVYNTITIKRPFTIVNINSDGVYRAEMLISAVTASFSYSQAIFMGYYTDKIYRIEYSNGTVSIKQLAEV